MFKDLVQAKSGLCLTFVAGWVDAVAFVGLAQVFVSAMSGNTTRLALAGAEYDGGTFRRYLLIIILFVTGVVIGEMLSRSRLLWRHRYALAFDAFLLFASIAAFEISWLATCGGLLALSMGLLNTTISESGAWSIRSYVTGTLVHLGKAIARWLEGEGTLLTLAPIILVWLAFTFGGIAGAVVALNWNLGLGLTLPALILGAMTFLIGERQAPLSEEHQSLRTT